MARSDKPRTVLDVLNRVLDFDNSQLKVEASELPAGVANASGDRTNPTLTDLRALVTALTLGTNDTLMIANSDASADGVAASTRRLGVGAEAKEFNATTWDRRRNNAETSPFASAARTATTNSADQTNYNARGVKLHLTITAVSGTAPTLDVKLQAKIAGIYIDIASAAFTQKSGTGDDELTVYPGIAETANESVSDIIPRTWRAVATIGGTSPSFTFQLDISYVN